MILSGGGQGYAEWMNKYDHVPCIPHYLFSSCFWTFFARWKQSSYFSFESFFLFFILHSISSEKGFLPLARADFSLSSFVFQTGSTENPENASTQNLITLLNKQSVSQLDMHACNRRLLSLRNCIIFWAVISLQTSRITSQAPVACWSMFPFGVYL